MSVRLKVCAIATASACLIMQSYPASAQNFDDRWSIIPKAHADPAPKQEDNQNQNQPAQTPVDSQSSERTSGDPASSKALNKVFSGKASYYSYTKGKTASGSPYNRDGMTAAHRSLPFGTRVRVTDVASSKSVVVLIVDRGPWIRDRVLDLSLGAARSLGITDRGVAQVRVEVL
jgi:rare lipoprotein A (peptidoglycan hydrolase)